MTTYLGPPIIHPLRVRHLQDSVAMKKEKEVNHFNTFKLGIRSREGEFAFRE